MSKGFRTLLAYTGGLIAAYLVFSLPNGVSTAGTAAQNFYTGGVKALQGR